MASRCATRRRFAVLDAIYRSYFRLASVRLLWWSRSCRISISESMTPSSMCCHQALRHSHECSQALYAPFSSGSAAAATALSAADRDSPDGRSQSSAWHANTSAKFLLGIPRVLAYRSCSPNARYANWVSRHASGSHSRLHGAAQGCHDGTRGDECGEGWSGPSQRVVRVRCHIRTRPAGDSIVTA